MPVPFTPMYWILDEHQQPVPVHDSVEWGRWFSNNDGKRFLARNTIDDYLVSTVFLDLDHNFSHKGPPVLWETLVGWHEKSRYGEGLHDEEMYRYTSAEEALKKHYEIVDRIAAQAAAGKELLDQTLKPGVKR